ncbi:MAG: hypothetical protein ACI4OZ_08750, partial [Akkermansia sp.]
QDFLYSSEKLCHILWFSQKHPQMADKKKQKADPKADFLPKKNSAVGSTLHLTQLGSGLL